MPRKKKLRGSSLAATKFNASHTTTCNIRLNYKTDQDIIQKLNEQPSKMGYVKGLIRSDIVANGYAKK